MFLPTPNCLKLALSFREALFHLESLRGLNYYKRSGAGLPRRSFSEGGRGRSLRSALSLDNCVPDQHRLTEESLKWFEILLQLRPIEQLQVFTLSPLFNHCRGKIFPQQRRDQQ